MLLPSEKPEPNSNLRLRKYHISKTKEQTQEIASFSILAQNYINQVSSAAWSMWSSHMMLELGYTPTWPTVPIEDKSPIEYKRQLSQ